MLTVEFIRAFVGEKMYALGMEVYQQGNVYDMNIRENQNGYTQISAFVEGNQFLNDHEVNITLSAKNEWIIGMNCNCRSFEHRHRPCEHITAVLIAYAKKDEELPILKPRHRKTNRNFKLFLDNYLLPSSPTDFPTANIILEPTVSFDFDHEEIDVTFKIGVAKERLYTVQNITELVENIEYNISKKYGKALEFTHSINAFRSECQPLVNFLSEYILEETADPIHYRSPYFQAVRSTASPCRSLSLQSYNVDQFLEIIKNLPFNIQYSKHTAKAVFIDNHPEFTSKIQKVDDGFIFSAALMSYINGKKYTYFVDRNYLYRSPKISRSMRNILDFFSQNSFEKIFIDNEDIITFTRNMYPVIQKNMTVKADGFEPKKYLPETPLFEVYLDMPQNDLVTGEIYAVYSHGKYNLFQPDQNQLQRDSTSESTMDLFFSSWFSSYDAEHRRMALADDEDKLYRFLKFGISEMQAKAAVYISDTLKKLKIHQSAHVSVGVSVNHDLLQLDFIADQINLKQLSEILSRYDPKKKFYRLKTGEFVDIDENINALAKFKDALNLSNTQLNSGSVTVPAYRAAYLNSLQNSTYLDIRAEENFRQLIRNMKDTAGIAYAIPREMDSILRPYQINGFRWLYALKENRLGGLLADEMGLGKTLQVITLLAAWKDRKRVLIVCPSSLVYNWSNEIRRFMPSMNHIMITGFANIRHELIRGSQENDVLITSYDSLKRDIKIYEQFEFSCQIIDEAQYIKNAATQAAQSVKAIHSSFRIALTGTPIENRLSELWSIFDYILPGFFGSYQKFRRNYELPIVRDQDAQIETELTTMITPFILRRRKKDVLKDLPDKIEEVYYGQLEGEQKELYEARVQRLKYMLQKQSDQEFNENKIAILSELTRLRQTCCDPALIYADYKGNSNKKELCLDILQNAIEEGHKILLFSQFTSMLDHLTDEFDRRGIKYHKLVGSTSQKDRATMVESFQNDNVPLFCISLKAGGTGLNLTAADIVIHYDPWWNTAVENQASDRAHRIGQQNVVNVFRLIIKDTIEERIIQLQDEKSYLADRILSGEGISSSSLSREDLLKLL